MKPSKRTTHLLRSLRNLTCFRNYSDREMTITQKKAMESTKIVLLKPGRGLDPSILSQITLIRERRDRHHEPNKP